MMLFHARPAARLVPLFVLVCFLTVPQTACGADPAKSGAPSADASAHPFDPAALEIGPDAEVATYAVAVEGDSRPLEVVSVLWVPPPGDEQEEEGAAPSIVRWQVYSESFESPRKAYHVRLVTFFDLDARSLVPRRRTTAFLTWEGLGCCWPLQRNADGLLQRQHPPEKTFEVSPRKILIGQLPLLVRAIRLPTAGRVELGVLRRDGTTVPVELALQGREAWPDPEEPGETIEAERITVRYEGLDQEVLLEGVMVATGAEEETYWREAGGNHQLLGIDTERYGTPMTVRLRGETRTTLDAPSPDAPAAEPTARGTEPTPADAGRSEEVRELGPNDPPALDEGFLSLPRWDDGLAELAYYDFDGEGAEGSDRLALSILVKHRIDPATGGKRDAGDPDAIDAFFSLFIGSLADPGAPVPVRRYVSAQARRQDLVPVTSAVAEVAAGDQCGASLWLSPGAGSPDRRTCHVRRPPPLPDRAVARSSRGVHMIQQMPLVIRALALETDPASEAEPEADLVLGEVSVRLPDGRRTTASIRYTGRETVDTPAGERTCERFEVGYRPPPDAPGAALLPDSLLGPLPETESYCRGTDEHRQILRMEADGRTLTLIEEIRAPHWSEDFYPRLERVTEVP